MSKNPFSIYDFMGYLFPGLLLIIIIVYVRDVDFDASNIFHFRTLIKSIEIGKNVFDLDKSILIIIIGYVTGHFVSYTSSITIETYANSIFGYPSEYLLHGNKLTWFEMWKKFFRCQASSSLKCVKKIKLFFKFLLELLVFVILLPISLMIFLFGWLVDINAYITRPIDEYLKTSIFKKQYDLAERLNIGYADVNEKCDYHRLVMHYVYINVPECQRKVDNYVSLYGFLRSVTLVFCLCFDYLLVYVMRNLNIHMPVNWNLVFELLALYLMCSLSFLGFMKFYRRNTLENYMTLLVGLRDVCDKK